MAGSMIFIRALLLASLARTTPAQNIITVAGVPFGGLALKSPSSVSVSPNGTLYFITSSVFVATLTSSQGLIPLAGGGANPPPAAAYPATLVALPPLIAIAAGTGGAFFALSATALYAVDASGSLTTLISGDRKQDGPSPLLALPIDLIGPRALAVHPLTGMPHVLEYYGVYQVRTDAVPPTWSVVVGATGRYSMWTAYNPESDGAEALGGIGGLGDVYGMAFSPAGDLYLAETSCNCVRVVWATGPLSGKIYRFAGAATGASGPASATALNAKDAFLNAPTAVAVAPSGDVFIADTGNAAVRRVSPAGIITTYAYSALLPGSSGAEGVPLLGILSFAPNSLAVAPDGNVYMTSGGVDSLLRVHSVTGDAAVLPPILSTTAAPAFALNTTFSSPKDIKLDDAGNIFVADTKGFAVRVVEAATGLVRAVAGGVSPGPAAVALAATNGGDGGPASAAFVSPVRLALARNGDIYILGGCLSAPACVRLVTKATGIISTVVARSPSSDSDGGDGGSAQAATLSASASGLAIDADGTLFVADTGAHAIRCIPRAANAGATISTCVGTYGVPANLTNYSPSTMSLHTPRGIAVIPNPMTERLNVYICDSFNFVVRMAELNRDTLEMIGSMETIAGSGKIAFYDWINSAGGLPRLDNGGDSTNPTSLNLAGPVDVAVVEYPVGFVTVYILDAIAGSGAVVHRVDYKSFTDPFIFSPVISRVVGDMTHPAMLPSGDGEKAIKAAFVNAEALALGATRDVSIEVLPTPPDTRDIYVVDSSANSVRMAFISGATLCPQGFFCGTGRDPQPCTSPAFYCPKNSIAPFPADAGYATVVAQAGYAGAPALSISQAPCSIGRFCSGGVASLCPGGTYGQAPLQAFAADCTTCSLGRYLAERGSTSAAACLQCPLGSYADSLGAVQCTLCPLGTAQPNVGAASPQACVPCNAGSTALPGAAACFPIAPGDTQSEGAGNFVFQRTLAVTDGNASPAAQVALVLRTSLPILAVAFVPYLLYVLWATRCNSHRIWDFFSRVDLYALESPEKKGESPTHNPTALGGTLALLSGGGVLTLMVTSFVSFSVSNTLLVQSSLALTPGALASFSSLPLSPVSVLAGVGGATYDPTLAALQQSSTVASGVTVTIRAMGARCSQVLPNSTAWGLAGGAFTYTFTASSTTGSAVHIFSCPSCQFNSLSYLTLALDGSCQSAAVTVAAVGVAGGVTVSGALVAATSTPLAAAAVTFPLSLEVIQDGVRGAAPRDSDGLVLGGRSAAGLVAGAGGGNLQTQPAPPASGAAPAPPLVLTIFLPLASVYALFTFTPIMGLISLASACAAWLGLLGVGGFLKAVHQALHEKCASRKGKGVAPLEDEGDKAAAGGKGAHVPEGAHASEEAAPLASETAVVELGSGKWVRAKGEAQVGATAPS